MADLSVVIVTHRIEWCASILQHYRNQSVGNLTTEPIVVFQCPPENIKIFERTMEFYGIPPTNYHTMPVMNDAGSYSRNLGIQVATSPYICFWDDEVIYYNHALTTLYAVAYGYDVGFAASLVRGYRNGYELVPREPASEYGANTMCYCVRTEVARRALWPTDHIYYTDTRWIVKILESQPEPTVRHVPIVVGIHV